MEKLSIIGNVAFVNEPRSVNGNKGATQVSDVGLVVNKRYKTSDGKKIEESKLYVMSFWAERSDVAQKHIEVGQTLFVEGEPTAEIYADKNGEAKIQLKIERFSFEFVGGAPSRRATNAGKPRVMANAGRLSQVFLNLLVNAAHSIDEGSPRNNTVEVTTKRRGGEVWIEVADTGRGIPREHLGRLFDPFFTTKAASLGSGLGLSICANIVRAHGGRIEVASELGRGSRFTVCLPESDIMDAPKPQPVPPPVATIHAHRSRILIVDDERAMRTTLAALLSDRYDVVTADSGASAIGTLKGDRAFDAVLCDLMMPDVSGVDVYAWMQAEAPALALRVVFMTGGAFTPRARDLLERVPNRHVEKPFELNELSAALEKATRPS